MKVLSLFDGISCARVALERSGIPVESYAACEINKESITCSSHNFPDIIQLGDVKNVTREIVGAIDLLIGGSPCQDLSISNSKRKSLQGERSQLFWEYSRILKEVKPKYFVLENVESMNKYSRDAITDELGVQPILLDANRVSAQQRKRYFWTNIKVIGRPKDRNLCISDILVDKPRRIFTITKPLKRMARGVAWDDSGKGHFSQQSRAYRVDGKCPALTSNRAFGKAKILLKDGRIAELLPEEFERLQGLPDGYTATITQKEKRGAAIGNGFNVDVICFILGFIPTK